MNQFTATNQNSESPCNPKLALFDGAPVRMKPWPSYEKGHVFINDEDEKAAIRALESQRYFRYDDRDFAETECGKLEQRIQQYFGVKHALACSSGTAALALSILAAGVPRGGLIACPGFTFAATPSSILLAGCEPYLVENDDNLNFDLDDLRRRWTDNIKAIVVVHMRGFASDMEAICEFANQKGVPIIEDAVPAMGAELNGRKLGTFGIAGAYSTQSDKSINTGEGGFIVTDDTDLFLRSVVLSGAYENRAYRHVGDDPVADRVCDLSLPIMSMRMDEIRAALACAQFDRLHVRLGAFRRNYDYVAGLLDGVSGIRLRQPAAQGALLGDSLNFMVDGCDAGLFAKALRLEGIDARNLGTAVEKNVRVFWNWRFMFKDRVPSEIQSELPRTTARLKQTIDIPLASTLEIQDCDDLVMAVRKVAGGLINEPPEQS